MKIKADNIREGDRFVSDGFTHWTAIQDAKTEPDPTTAPGEYAPTVVTVLVRFSDGGTGYRGWKPGEKIEIERS